MTDRSNFNPETDPQLAELLGTIRRVPPRDPQAVERSYARFLSEVDDLFAESPSPAPTGVSAGASASPTGWIAALSAALRRQVTAPQRLVFSGLVALLVILVLFAGASATVAVAQGSLPGDTLYPVKVNLEDVQARLSRDAATQARLHLSFAERRLDEIARLIADRRYDDITIATAEFEDHLQAAIDSLLSVAAGDPAAAQDLARQISSALSRYAQVLSGMLMEVPETVRPDMQRAITLSEGGASVENGEVEFSGIVESISPQSWKIGGRSVAIDASTEIKGTITIGDRVKVHASLVSGTLLAREIAPEDGQPAQIVPFNTNDNDDDGEDDNININANDNDDNGNDNGDDDLNDNDDGDNLNDNDDDGGDDDMNDNDDDGGDDDLNDNDDSGDNDNGDDGGDNNSGDNDNDNSGDGDNDNGDDDGNSNDDGDDKGDDNVDDD